METANMFWKCFGSSTAQTFAPWALRLRIFYVCCACVCCGCTVQQTSQPNNSGTQPTRAQPPSESPPTSRPAELVKPIGIDGMLVRIEQVKGLDVGCGVIVRSTKGSAEVLTADHLLAAGDSYVVIVRSEINGKLVDRSFKTADVVLRDPKRDLACLRVKIDTPLTAAAELSVHKSPAKFQAFEAWGVQWERGEIPSLVKLRIVEQLAAQRNQRAEPVSYWRAESDIELGMSGGPLLDGEGHLLGIASGNSSGAAYYVDLDEVREFLREAGL